MLNEEKKRKIREKIIEELPDTFCCPMCHNNDFSIADGYFLNNLQEQLYAYQLTTTALPTIGLICNHCGFVSQHALGILGLLPSQEGKNVSTTK
ncbi:MAG: hypothetical protein LBT05_08165 [Planctomycetaceae bacterium]|jgi:rubredoxin|nr:hypothetical protein [Planctomycetaceae bacterium]